MKRPRGPTGLALGLVLALVLGPQPVGAAEEWPLVAEVDVAAAARFSGTADAATTLAGLLYDTGPDPAPIDFSLEAAGARLRLINFPRFVLDAAGYGEGPLPEEVLVDEAFTGRLVLERAEGGGSYRIFPVASDGAFTARLAGPQEVTIEAPRDLQGVPGLASVSFMDPHGSRILHPLGWGGIVRTDATGPVPFEGALLSLVYGGVFRAESDNGESRVYSTGERVNESLTRVDPVTGSGLRVYDRYVLLLEAALARGHVAASDPSRLLLAAVGLEGTWAGDWSWSSIQGRVHVGDASLPERGHLLQAVGVLEGASTYERGGAAAWSLDGSVTFVAVDGATWAGERPAAPSAMSSPVVASAAAALLVALVAFLLYHWGHFAGAFYARFGPERVLDHPRRRLTYEVVCQSPGSSVARIAGGLGWSVNAVKYHLRVLERTHLVMLVRHGGLTLAAPYSAVRGHAEDVRRSFLRDRDEKVAYTWDLVSAQPRAPGEVVGALVARFGISRRGALYVVQRGLEWGLLVRDASRPEGPVLRARPAEAAGRPAAD